jgi:group I intron endonuclease
MEYYGVIYQGELNGQVYVGQHVGMDVEKRWREHLNPKSGCVRFRNAIQKYGKDKVVWSIIAYCKVGGQDRLDAMERYFIKKRNSLSPNGYNLEKGGRGGVPCEESKQKMSISTMKYYAETPGALEKQSEATKKYFAETPGAREKHSDARKKYFAETPGAVEKNSEALKKYFAENPEAVKRGENNPMFGKTGADHHNSKKIRQYELDGETFVREWDCARDAYRELGINFTSISHACRGVQKTSGGFVWCYVD